MSIQEFHIRLLNEQDSIEELTDILHKSYKQLKDRGYYSLATHQTAEITKRRIAEGKCLVAVVDEKMIGTLTYVPAVNASGHEWYNQKNVGICRQFGVIPEMQRTGIGTALLAEAEKLAMEEGTTELALDTVGEAGDLVDYYVRRGFRKVGEAQWKEVNYRSVILSKKLDDEEI